jgi:hypothetical protein
MVIANDGVNETSAVSEPFAVANKPPTIAFRTPQNDEIFTQGDPVTFSASFYDLQDGELSGGPVSFSSDRDGMLGEGQAVTVDSLSPGKHTVTLKALNSAGQAVTASVSISVRAAGPSAQVSEPSLDFGNVPVGSTKDAQITISNTGDASLIIEGLSASGTGFSVAGPPVPVTVSPSASATVSLRFAPTSAGAQSGVLVISSNDPTQPQQRITLTGTGTQPPMSGSPSISAIPSTLAFGNVTIGQSSDMTVAISNRGAAALVVSSLTASGTGFSVTGPSTPLTILPGAASTVTVRFAPSSAGPQTGTLLIASNDPATPSLTISLSASGTVAPSPQVPVVDISPATLDFGTVASGQMKDLTLTVRNNGSAALMVNSTTSSNPRFTIMSPSTPFNVGAGSSQGITVRFTPTGSGAQTGTLTFASNDPVRPTVTINVSGTAPGTTGGVTTLSVDDGSFEQVVGITGGAPAVYFLNRLTPPTYPATLKSVQIMFLNLANALKPGDTIRILVGTNPGGSSGINNIRLLAATTSVGTIGEFNTFEAPAGTTIPSGDFVVGFTSGNPAGLFPGSLDTTTPNRQRSYVSLDGITFQLLDSGNVGIRATVDLAAAGSAAAITRSPQSLVFNSLHGAKR